MLSPTEKEALLDRLDDLSILALQRFAEVLDHGRANTMAELVQNALLQVLAAMEQDP